MSGCLGVFVCAEVRPTMKELGVDAMETFQDAVELAGPVMDNVNRAGMHGCMCGCMRVRFSDICM